MAGRPSAADGKSNTCNCHRRTGAQGYRPTEIATFPLMQIIGIVIKTLEHVGNTRVEVALKRVRGCMVCIAYMNNIQCDVYTYAKGTIIPE